MNVDRDTITVDLFVFNNRMNNGIFIKYWKNLLCCRMIIIGITMEFTLLLSIGGIYFSGKINK